METRSQREHFRSLQSSVMVRRSHVAMEFIGVTTGNGHCTIDKNVAIRHSACDRALGAQRHTLGVCTTKHNVCDRVVLS